MGEQEKHQENQALNQEPNNDQLDPIEQVLPTEQEAQGEGNNQSTNAALEVAQEEIVKLKDAYLRAKAEEDNIRRRSEKEVANSRKFAIEGFAKELLPVFDSLKLASTVDAEQTDAEEADVAKQVQEGVQITLKQLGTAFTKFGLVEVAPEVGDKLDPNVHQAMSQFDSPDVKSGCIVAVMQPGFQLNERLLRPAMVVVSK